MLNRMGPDGRAVVQRPKCQTLNPKEKCSETFNVCLHSFWKKIFWSNETMVNRMGPKCQTLNPRYAERNIPHSRETIMAWGVILWRGIGPIVKINEKWSVISI